MIIIFLTYIVGVGRFSHIVAGSVEAAFAVFSGDASIWDYCSKFLGPTLVGNTLGGVGGEPKTILERRDLRHSRLA